MAVSSMSIHLCKVQIEKKLIASSAVAMFFSTINLSSGVKLWWHSHKRSSFFDFPLVSFCGGPNEAAHLLAKLAKQKEEKRILIEDAPHSSVH